MFLNEFLEYPSNICFDTKAIWRIEPYDFTFTCLFLVCLGVSGFWDKCNVVMETTFCECI